MEALLAFSRAGGKETSPQHADATREVAGAIELLSDSLRETETHVEQNLPDSAPVAIAPALLHVVFVNVIGNAVKFMAGGLERRLMIDATRTLVGWRFCFTDTGPGISEREIPRVFDAFYRGARSAGGGIGLGLATVKRIVESRGGTVSIASTQGRGTTVTLELPEFSAAPAAAIRARSSAGGEARQIG